HAAGRHQHLGNVRGRRSDVPGVAGLVPVEMNSVAYAPTTQRFQQEVSFERFNDSGADHPTNTPPRKPGSNGVNRPRVASVVPLYDATTGATPGPPPTTTSARPSESRSSAATRTPSAAEPGNGVMVPKRCPSSPLKVLTCADVPRLWLTTKSA